ncbi:MAG: nuclease-related domain-containing protein [Planctomycetota bacterium]
MPKNLPEKKSPLKQPPPRQAGASVQDELDEFLWGEMYWWFIMPLLLLVSAALMWVMVWLKTPTRTIAWILTAYFLLSIVLAVYRFYHSRHKIHNLKQGRDGERVVGHLLEDLRKQGYHVFHDIPNTKKATFNIDHALVGPAGVFTIETKTYSKLTAGDKNIRYENNRLTIPGLSREHADKALTQAKAAANFIQKHLTKTTGQKVLVQPILVFPGWWVNETNTPGDTSLPLWVLNENRISLWINNTPACLSKQDIRLYTHRLQMHINDCEV